MISSPQRSAGRPGRRRRHATTLQQLRDEIGFARGLLCDEPVAFFDTVAVLLRGDVSDRARGELDIVRIAAEIEKHCGHVTVHTSKACGRGYPYRLTMHQPQTQALQLFDENLDHVISEFHVALDLPTETAADAGALASVIERLRVQPWHGKRKVRLVNGVTSYMSAERRTARNLVIYGDRPSKVTKEPCCHVEFRYGARACKARGVRACGDLLGYDYTRWIDRDVKLGLIDWPSACSILRQLADLERRRYRRNPSRRPKALLPLVKRTFERLQTLDHMPSFDDPPIVGTQRQLEVMPKWSTALVWVPLAELLRARSDYEDRTHRTLNTRLYSEIRAPVTTSPQWKSNLI